MAAQAAVQRTYLNDHVDADLMFIWAESGMNLQTQHDLAVALYRTVRKFAGIEDDRVKVRAAMAADLGLDVNAIAPQGALNRQELAAIVSAWEMATETISKELQIRAESRAHHLTRPISSQEKSAMKRAAELLLGHIPSHETPSADYLSTKTEEMESNDPMASQLDEVTSIDDVDGFSMQATVDLSGKVQMIKKRAKIALPTGAEEFRMRLRVEANTWVFMMTKFTNRQWIQGLTALGWQRYTDYFLGSKVLLLKIPVGSGEMAIQPPWSTILHYEFACRKQAFRLVKEDGVPLFQALIDVTKDAEMKEIHFTSPIALSGHGGRKRPSDQTDPNAANKRQKAGKGGKGGKGGRGNGKGGKGVKGAKGGGKGAKGPLLARTPDGREICFAFNGEGCNDAECSRAHVCRRRGCLGPHPMGSCTAAPAAAV